MPTVITGTEGINQVQAGAVESGDLPAGSVIQVVQSVKDNAFSTAATSFTDIPDLSVSITPTSTSSKILVQFTIGNYNSDGVARLPLRVLRNGSEIGVGDGVNGLPCTVAALLPIDRGTSTSASFLDSPSSASSLTYKIQGFAPGGDTMYVNHRGAVNGYTTISTITVMEIAG